jgi:putative membrane-bound dehydrogenase-like protein
VPPGFVVERVAGPPLVEHPTFACFDDRGRLFVAESAGLNLPAAQLLSQLPDRILLLEDTDGDGRFDKRTVFADRMSFPMGVLWHDGAVYAAAPPSLWKLEDTDGDGRADRRTELVTRFGFTGNAADIHGPFPGPDGRLYWTDGRHGHEIRQPDGHVLTGKAARIFRCRPDGGEVEVVCGGGMDDPVEIAFTPEGEAFATVDILLSRPQRVDAIIHCVEGGVFPYNEVVREFKRTGDLLPAMIDLGWVAPCGLMRYRDAAFGAEYRDNLFSTQFNTHRIRRHVLERDGATFRGRTEDFLASDHPDFHPTDVLQDADGSLLVVDTGGWFRIGCPTSRVAKPEVLGGIYRVRRKDAPPASDPRGLQLKWDGATPAELVARLDDPRFAVRDRAVRQTAKAGDQALPALSDTLKAGASARTRRNAAWALCRMESPAADALIRRALSDPDLSVRLTAAHAAGLHRDAAAGPGLTKLVTSDPVPAVRREAATGLGRIRDAKAVPALLEGLRSGADRFLEHALIYALIEIADPTATRQGLADVSPAVRRGALIALDQMTGGTLAREDVAPLLASTDLTLRRTALEVISARPGWADAILVTLRDCLREPHPDAARLEALDGVLLAFCGEPAVQDLVAQSLRDEATPQPTRLWLLEAMARAPLDRLPATWVGELRWQLDSADERVVRQAVAAVRAARAGDCDHVLRQIAADAHRPDDVRLAALRAAAPRLPAVDPALFAFLTRCLTPDAAPLTRLTAAEALGDLTLDPAQLRQLGGAMARADALALPPLLAAYERSADRNAGLALVAALAKAPGLPSLTPEAVAKALARYPAEVRETAAPVLKTLDTDLEQQTAKLKELEPLLAGGDAARGRAVFVGAKAACATCHAVRGEGGRVGPDLSTVGGIRSGRDLLESVVLPSASFVRGYEPYRVETHDGRVTNGVLARETAEAVYLVTADRTELRVPRASIAALERSRTSIMPQGLDAQLSREELRDLFAFLQALR